MASHWEVKFWANGVRTVEIYEKHSQAVAGASRRPYVGLEISEVHSTQDILKEFRRIRKIKPAKGWEGK